jgi:hypothetical protein
MGNIIKNNKKYFNYFLPPAARFLKKAGQKLLIKVLGGSRGRFFKSAPWPPEALKGCKKLNKLV